MRCGMELVEMLKDLGCENPEQLARRRKLRGAWYISNMDIVQRHMDLSCDKFEDFHYNVLFVSDRLLEIAVGLAYFVKHRTNGTVDVCDHVAVAFELWASHEPVDFLVYVGYQENTVNYDMIRELRNDHAPPPKIIMVASMDGLIGDVCSRYGIQYFYDKNSPMAGLVRLMLQIKDDPEVVPDVVEQAPPASLLTKFKGWLQRNCTD